MSAVTFDPAHFSVVRAFLRWAGRRSLCWFYRETAVVELSPMPARGPVLLVGNHPNDLPDVVLGLQTSARHVRYLATIAAGTGGIAAKGYREMGVIPVTRVRDARKMRAMGIDMAAVNIEAGRLVTQALAAGHVVGVFPQGGVHDIPQIGRLRTGVAMMALAALDSGVVNDVTVVPFGVQYEAPRTPGTDAYAVVGHGWSLRGWRDERLSRGLEGGVAALTEQLRLSLLEVTRNAATWEEADQRDELIAALAAVLPPEGAGSASLLERSARLVPIAERVVNGGMFSAGRLAGLVRELGDAVHAAGGLRTSARDHARLLQAAGVVADAKLRPIGMLLLLTPVALFGWITHGAVFAGIWRLAHRLTRARADVVARTLVPGLHIMLLWYLLLAALCFVALLAKGVPAVASIALTVLLLIVLPNSADVAVQWRNGWRGHGLMRRVRQWPASRKAEIVRAAEALRGEWSARAESDSAA